MRDTSSLGVPQVGIMSQNFTWWEVKQRGWTWSFLISSVWSLYGSYIMNIMLLVFTLNFQTTLVFSVVILLLFLAECLCVDFNCFDPEQLVEIAGRWWEPQSWHASLWLLTPVNNGVEFLNATNFIYVCNMWYYLLKLYALSLFWMLHCSSYKVPN